MPSLPSRQLLELMQDLTQLSAIFLVATVSDADSLQEQPFFSQAKNGDKVLIYTNARKAILYDPISQKIVDNPVDTTVAATYIINYTVSDVAGNTATPIQRTVNVTGVTDLPPEPPPTEPVVDTTVPTITLIGSATIDLIAGDTYVDQGATALDDTDGDITANITTDNTVDTSIARTYTVTYSVSDSAGNAAIEVIRTVNVVDIIPPSE